MNLGRFLLILAVVLTFPLMAQDASAQTITLNQIEHQINDGGDGIQAGDTISFTFTVGGDMFSDLDFVDILTPGKSMSLSGPDFIGAGAPPIEIVGTYIIDAADISAALVSLTNVQATGDSCGDGCIESSQPPQNYQVPLPLPATFIVAPWFEDGNPASVTIQMTCSIATPMTASQSASDSSDAVFNLSDVGVNNTCSAVQTSGPPGYNTSYFNCTNVNVGPGDTVTCYVDNYFEEVEATVALVSDAAEPNQNGSFRIQLDGSPPFGGMNIAYSVSGTATSGEDYEALNSIFIPYGNTSQLIAVNVIDDEDIEPTETVIFSLDSPGFGGCDGSGPSAQSGRAGAGGGSTCETYYVGEPGDVTVDIEDNDATATFTVVKWFEDDNPASVQITVSCTDAIIDSSTQSASQSSAAVFTLTDVGTGNTCSATESGGPPGYQVEYYNCSSVPLPGGSSDYCYVDNYYIPVTAQIQQQSNAAEPSQNGSFQVSLSGSPPFGGMDVNFTVAGTADPDVDYEELSGAVFFPFGSTTEQIPVDVIDDNAFEDTETVIVTLDVAGDGGSCNESSVQARRSSGGKPGTEEVCEGYEIGSSAQATVDILDDDRPLVAIETIEDASEPNTDGSFRIFLRVPAPDGGVTVRLVADGSATAGVDYTSLPTEVTFAEGDTSLSLVVSPIDDDEIEGTEEIKLFIGPSDDYSIVSGSSPARMNILDDDVEGGDLSLSIAATSSTAEPSGTGQFTVSLSEPSEGETTVSFSLGGTATAGIDYVEPASPVVIPAGGTSATIDVVVIDDDLVEETETVSVTLSMESGVPITGDPTATINIEDDDEGSVPTPGIVVDPTSGLVTTEDGGTAQFTVVLKSEPSATVTIDMESSDTTEGTIAPMTLEFNSSNWNMAKAVTVTGVADEEVDGDQDYSVILKPAVSSDPNYSALDASDVSVLNKDMDVPPPPEGGAEFVSSLYSVKEADGTASIGIRRTGSTDGALTVTFSTDDDNAANTATAGEDYTSTSAEVSWVDGEDAEKFVDVTVFENEDKDDSVTESVALKLVGSTIETQSSTLEILSEPPEPEDPPISPEDLPPNQQQVVKVINTSCPQFNNEPGFQALCTAMVVTDSSLGESLRETTADDAAVVRSSGMQTANIQVTAVDGRIGTLRGGGGAGFTASGFSVALGEMSLNGGLMKSFVSAFDQNSPEFLQANANGTDDDSFIDEFGRWGAWISGRVIMGKKDLTTNQLDYDFDTAGLTFGMDYRFSDTLVGGVAVGYANTDSDLGTDDGKVKTKGYSVSLYGTWFPSDKFYLGGSLGYGGNDYDHTRNVRYTIDRPAPGNPILDALPDWAFDVDQSFAASYDGRQYSAAISGGWDFNKNGWTFGPTFRIDWTDVKVDGYDEILARSNTGNIAEFGWAVHIDDQKYTSLQPAIGFEFSKAVSKSWGIFIPQGYIDVVSELSDDGILVTGRYLGDVNRVPFALETDDFTETFIRAGLGFGLVLKNNKSAFFMVDGDLGRDLLRTYYINAGFRWQF